MYIFTFKMLTCVRDEGRDGGWPELIREESVWISNFVITTGIQWN
jgi:hypothetical protein